VVPLVRIETVREKVTEIISFWIAQDDKGIGIGGLNLAQNSFSKRLTREAV
jgi:hypothetical protein